VSTLSGDILRIRGVFRCRRPHFLMQKQKISDFLKFMVCPHGHGGEVGFSQCGHFSDRKEEVVNLSLFCADVLYGLAFIRVA